MGATPDIAPWAIPAESLSAVIRLHDALTGALPLAGTRQLSDGPTVEELALESAFAGSLGPILRALYSAPNVAALASKTERQIYAAILDYYRANPARLEPLAEALAFYERLAFNVGGALGLHELGVPGNFDLADESILATIDERVEALATADGALSLPATTAAEIAAQVAAFTGEVAALPGALAAYALGRSVVRSGAIAATESVTMTRTAMVWVFYRNGVSALRFRTQRDDRVCPICEPLDRQEYQFQVGAADPTAAIPASERIPLHVGCRCFYQPVRVEIGDTIWVGTGGVGAPTGVGE